MQSAAKVHFALKVCDDTNGPNRTFVTFAANGTQKSHLKKLIVKQTT
jgi:hypothetical protein